MGQILRQSGFTVFGKSLQGIPLPPLSVKRFQNIVLVLTVLLSLDNKLSQRMAVTFEAKVG